jgi:hypothetical protein
MRLDRVTISTPSPFDFSLVTISPPGPTAGLRLGVVGAGSELLVGAAVARASRFKPAKAAPNILKPPLDPHPGRIFVVIVNREQAGSTEAPPSSVGLRIQTGEGEADPTVAEDADVLAGGAPGADCSMQHYFPGFPGANDGAWSFVNAFVVLKPLFDWRSGQDVVSGTAAVEDALNTACGGLAGGEFSRWVRQEPPPPHP